MRRVPLFYIRLPQRRTRKAHTVLTEKPYSKLQVIATKIPPARRVWYDWPWQVKTKVWRIRDNEKLRNLTLAFKYLSLMIEHPG